MAGLKHPVTSDGRSFVVRGKLWRMANPNLTYAERSELVGELIAARRTTKSAKLAGDPLRKRRPIMRSMPSNENSVNVVLFGGQMDRRIHRVSMSVRCQMTAVARLEQPHSGHMVAPTLDEISPRSAGKKRNLWSDRSGRRSSSGEKLRHELENLTHGGNRG